MDEKQFKQFIKDYRYLIKEQILSVDEAMSQINDTIKENIDLQSLSITQENIRELLEEQTDNGKRLAKEIKESSERSDIRFQGAMNTLAAPLRMVGKMRGIADMQVMGDLRAFISSDISQVIGEDRKLLDLGLIIKDGILEMSSNLSDNVRGIFRGFFGARKYDDDDIYHVLENINDSIDEGFSVTHAMNTDIGKVQNMTLSEINKSLADSYKLQNEIYLRQLRDKAEKSKGFSWWQKLGLAILAGALLGGYLAKVLLPIKLLLGKSFDAVNMLVKSVRFISKSLVSAVISFFSVMVPPIVMIYDAIFNILKAFSRWFGVTTLFENVGKVLGREIGKVFQISIIDKTFDIIVNTFGKIGNMVKGTWRSFASINKWFAAIAVTIESIIGSVVETFMGIKNSSWKLTKAWEASFSLIRDVAKHIQNMFGMFASFLSKSTNPILTFIKTALRFIKNIGILKMVFAPIVAGFELGFIAGLRHLGIAFSVIFGFVDFFIGFFRSKAKDLVGKLADGLTSALRGFINPLLDLIGYILYFPAKWLGFNIFDVVINPLKQLLDVVYKMIAQPIALTLGVFAALTKTLWGLMSIPWDMFKLAIGIVIAAIKTFFKIIRVLWNIITFDFGEAMSVFKGIGTMWKKLIFGFFDSVISTFKSIGLLWWKLLASAWDYIIELVKTIFNVGKITNSLSKLFWVSIKLFFVQMLRRSIDFLKNLPSMIENFFVTLFEKAVASFYSLVKYIGELPFRLIAWIRGFNDRAILFFQNTWAAIVSWVTGLATRIWAWLENFVKIDAAEGGGAEILKKILKSIFTFAYNFTLQSIKIWWRFIKFAVTAMPKLFWWAATKAVPAMLKWFVTVLWELAKVLMQLPWFIIKGLVKMGWYILTHLDDIAVWLITKGVPMILKIVLKLLVMLGELLLNIIKGVLTLVLSIPVTLFTLMMGMIKATFDAIVAAPTAIKDFITGQIEAVMSAFMSLFHYLAELPGKIIDAVKSWAIDKIPGASWFLADEAEVPQMATGGLTLGTGIAMLHPNEIVGPAREVIPQIIKEVTGGGDTAGRYSRGISEEEARIATDQLVGVRQVRDMINSTKQTIESTSKNNTEATNNHMKSISRDRQQPMPMEPPADIEALGILFFNKTWGVS